MGCLATQYSYRREGHATVVLTKVGFDSVDQWTPHAEKVDLFDLSEYNPLIEEERTGLLAVGIFYHFCLGVASRKKVQ